MNVARSPPQSPNTCYEGNRDPIAIASGIGRSETTGGSQPDLRKAALSDYTNQVTYRTKRKQPHDDFSVQFEKFQTKMESLITDMAKTQAENLNKISQDVSAIKEEISQIKLTTDLLSTEQVKMKSELANISGFRANIEQKVNTIENEIATLKSSSTPVITTPLFNYEDIVSETYDRSLREKNVIIRGVKEIRSSNSEDRQFNDSKEVKKVIKMAVSDCIEPTKTIRLGKYNPDVSRPIKVIFSTSEAAKSILRHKANIKDENIKIYSDETPNQKKHRNNLRDELKRRLDEGEKDITIKYVKGIPKIIKTQPKN